MGMFDTFHVEYGCGQVKIYDRNFGYFKIGDKVTIDDSINYTHSVYLSNGMWANVTNSVYVSLTDSPIHTKTVDKWGYPVDNTGRRIDNGKDPYWEV